MLKLMIADDEHYICTLIERLIDFETYDFDYLGSVHDGFSALEKIREEKPDIVITDIKMPGMDGIELIRRTREENQDIHFIILSGYQTFDYARSAVRYQVDDYLLKPINGKALNKTLEKVCKLLAVRDMNRAKSDDMERRLEYAQQRAKDYFLFNVMYNPSVMEEKRIEQINWEYHLSFAPGILQVGILELSPIDKQQRLTEIVNRAEQSLRAALETRCLEYKSLVDKERVVFVMNYTEEMAPRMQSVLNYAFHAIAEAPEYAGFVHMALLLGDQTRSPQGLHDSFCAADNCMNLGVIRGWGACYTSIQAEPYTPSMLRISAEEQEHLLRAMESPEQDALAGVIAELVNRRYEVLCRYPAHLGDLMKLLDVVADHAAGQGVDRDSFSQLIKDAGFAQSTCTRLEEVIALLTETVRQMKVQMDEILASKQSMPIVYAKKYIKAHFAQPITLEEVAKEVFLSPSYFSALFRKETGETLSNYLANVRIAQAKQMLAHTQSSIAEIAEAVGYPDQRYFSRIFKKCAGVTPKEFQRLQSYGLPDQW